MLLSFGSVTGAAPSYPTTRSFFIKYYSIAFAILTGLAGGLALELRIQSGLILKVANSRRISLRVEA
jgi:hypothetical protein